MSPLAWGAHIRQDRTIHAHIGSQVEERNGMIFEGAWNGPFEDAEFDSSYSFMGSGIKKTEWGAIAVAPCHTTELLYSMVIPGNGVYVGNSIALLLKATGGLTPFIRSRHYVSPLIP